MFYATKDHHGLPHDPFKSLVVPRPIGWISTISKDGTPNLAPFSFYNAIAIAPPMVMFCPNGRSGGGRLKDTLTNVEETGEFVVNLATEALKDKMNLTSAHIPAEEDEFGFAGLTAIPSTLVKPSRVAESPAHLECIHYQTLSLPATDPKLPNDLVLGRVIGIHIDDSVIEDGLVDIGKIRPLARLGYRDYTIVDNVLTMPTPD